MNMKCLRCNEETSFTMFIGVEGYWGGYIPYCVGGECAYVSDEFVKSLPEEILSQYLEKMDDIAFDMNPFTLEIANKNYTGIE